MEKIATCLRPLLRGKEEEGDVDVDAALGRKVASSRNCEDVLRARDDVGDEEEDDNVGVEFRSFINPLDLGVAPTGQRKIFIGLVFCGK